MAKKRIKRLAFFPVLIMLMAGCSNELYVNDPGDPIPIVYCLVNPEDSFCYVTVSKSYSTYSNALDILNTGSPLKVDDAKATLEAWGSGYKLWETGFSLIEDTLQVNELYPVARSTYKSDKSLCFKDLPVGLTNRKSIYQDLRLVVTSPQLNSIAYSRIPIINGPGEVSPVKGMALHLFGRYETDFWAKLDRGTVKYISFVCDFHYREFIDHWEEKCVHFIAKKNESWQQIDALSGGFRIRLYENFLNQIAKAIPDDPEVFLRMFSYMDFKLVIGDKNIDDYVDTYVNAGARDANAYTNIINGFGLFSLVRSASYPSITFERQTLDSLLYGRLTKHLKFKEW
jgi:hypothetical protein